MSTELPPREAGRRTNYSHLRHAAGATVDGVPGRRAGWVLFALVSISGCGSCVRYADCRLRRSFASCQQGPDCMPFDRCAPGGGAGRCEATCAPYGGVCRLGAGARPDECLVDMSHGNEPRCFSNGRREPDRCQVAHDAKGRLTCVDGDPPCQGCAMTFDTCIARNHCTGVVCF